jgi:tetratricopeptide (TPR) repeat protein
MSDEISKQQAMILVERARRLQMRGEFADAILLYRRSLALQPTSEAFTFLGWTYSMMNRYQEAIDSCKMAIEVDSSFGNPYNDIGAYLIELHRWEEAIPWLEKALEAPRYKTRHFPHMNLGRVYEQMGRYRTALDCYDQALNIDPYDRSSSWAMYRLIGRLN